MEKPHVDLDQAPVEAYGPLPLEELGDAGIVGGKVSMCYMVVVSNAPWIGGYKPNPFLIPIKTSKSLCNPCKSLYFLYNLGGWFEILFIFTQTLGKWSNFTNIVFKWVGSTTH